LFEFKLSLKKVKLFGLCNNNIISDLKYLQLRTGYYLLRIKNTKMMVLDGCLYV